MQPKNSYQIQVNFHFDFSKKAKVYLTGDKQPVLDISKTKKPESEGKKDQEKANEDDGKLLSNVIHTLGIHFSDGGDDDGAKPGKNNEQNIKNFI
jgi:hypothetical protein